MREWLKRRVRRDMLLVLWGLGFVLLISAVVHVLEPRRIVKLDEVLAEAKGR